MRKSDYVARSTEGETEKVISRVGGDEFIVLAHDLNQAQDAAKMSHRLLVEMSTPYDLNGREIFLTVSIGIALYPDDGTDVDDLLKNDWPQDFEMRFHTEETQIESLRQLKII